MGAGFRNQRYKGQHFGAYVVVFALCGVRFMLRVPWEKQRERARLRVTDQPQFETSSSKCTEK